MKHLALDYFFVRELNAKELEVRHIPSTHQLADVLIKPMPKSLFDILIGKIGVAKRSPIL